MAIKNPKEFYNMTPEEIKNAAASCSSFFPLIFLASSLAIIRISINLKLLLLPSGQGFPGKAFSFLKS